MSLAINHVELNIATFFVVVVVVVVVVVLELNLNVYGQVVNSSVNFRFWTVIQTEKGPAGDTVQWRCGGTECMSNRSQHLVQSGGVRMVPICGVLFNWGYKKAHTGWTGLNYTLLP